MSLPSLAEDLLVEVIELREENEVLRAASSYTKDEAAFARDMILSSRRAVHLVESHADAAALFLLAATKK